MIRTFADTNILVYADQPASRWHLEARLVLRSLVDSDNDIWISRQILREYAATMTRPGPSGVAPLSPAQAAVALQDFTEAFSIAEDGPNTTTHLIALFRSVDLGGKQVHDANIVATMLANGIGRLLTYNHAHFKRFANYIEIVDPTRV